QSGDKNEFRAIFQEEATTFPSTAVGNCTTFNSNFGSSSCSHASSKDSTIITMKKNVSQIHRGARKIQTSSILPRRAMINLRRLQIDRGETLSTNRSSNYCRSI